MSVEEKGRCPNPSEARSVEEDTTLGARRFPARKRVAIGLGSNVGLRLGHLRAAAARLGELLDRLQWSAVYETDPVHVLQQRPFLNACCVGLSDLAPRELLDRLASIERAGGRKAGGIRFGPREIDLDILLYGDEVVDTEDLTIPHPRLHERAFALIPLAGLAPNWQHATLGCTVGDLRDRVSGSGVRRTEWVLTGEDE